MKALVISYTIAIICAASAWAVSGPHYRAYYGALYGFAGFDPPATSTVGIVAAGQNVWVELDGCVSGELSGFTHSGCDLTAELPGMYTLSYSISFVGGTNKDYDTGVSINDVIVADPGCRTERTMGASATVGNVATGICGLSLSASDVVKLEMRGTEAVSADVTTHAVTMGIHSL
jgi:hypothetical protein